MWTSFLPAKVWLFAAGTLLAQAPPRSLYRVDTVAGNPSNFDGGPATNATFNNPVAIALAPGGGFYVSDANRVRVRFVNADGTIRTVAGNGFVGDSTMGVPALESRLRSIHAMAVSPAGELHLAEGNNCRISKVDSAGILRAVAGTGVCGFGGDGGPATAAQLRSPWGLAFDSQGRLHISDNGNNRIRRVNANGNIETIAGTGANTFSGADGTPALQTPTVFPMGLAPAADGTLYFVEWGYNRIRRIAPDGRVFTVAGDGNAGLAGEGGPGPLARLRNPRYIALDAPRNRLLISDTDNNRIRRVDLSSGNIGTVVGIVITNQPNLVFAAAMNGDGGPPSNAGIAAPAGIAVDASGSILFADSQNNRVRRADTVIRTVAGRFANTADGPADRAELLSPNEIAFLPNGELLISDSGNRIIRRLAGGNVSIFAGTPDERLPANVAFSSSGDGGTAAAARFNGVLAMAVDAAGQVFLNDGSILRRIEPPNIFRVGATTQFLASGLRRFVIDGARRRLYAISGNKIVVADLSVAVPTFRDFAGTGQAAFSGDGGPALQAALNAPNDLALDRAGNLYIAEDNRLRRVSIEDSTIRTLAGNGTSTTAASSGADIAATAGAVSPASIAVDSGGRVVMSEFASYLRIFDPATNRVRPIAGTGVRGSSGDGGLATGAQVIPELVRTDAAGNIYFTEFETGVVRVLRPVALTRLEAVSGADQSAAAGTRLTAPLVVRVSTATGPIAGAAVTFTATGGATLNPATAISDRDGLARTEVTLGATPGAVTVTAAVAGLPNVTFRATATDAVVINPNRPAIRATGGLATAGAFGGEARISPGTWMEIYGTNLATTTRSWAGDDFRGANAPTELDGVRVTVAGRPAFVAFISPNQINVQVPDGIGTGSVNVVVTNTNGASDPVSITAAAASPGLLSPPVFNVGGVQYIAALHQDNVFVGRENLIAGVAFRPARTGDVLTLYGVGFGATATPVPAGQVVPGAAALGDVQVRLGDQNATVLFGGLAPNAVGLYQFNIVVPAGVTPGDAAITVSAGGRASVQQLRLTVAP